MNTCVEVEIFTFPPLTIRIQSIFFVVNQGLRFIISFDYQSRGTVFIIHIKT